LVKNWTDFLSPVVPVAVPDVLPEKSQGILYPKWESAVVRLVARAEAPAREKKFAELRGGLLLRLVRDGASSGCCLLARERH
jgi:hypothetical protein